MANTAERDGAYAVKNYTPWRTIAEAVGDPDVVQQAFADAWNMGQAQGERDGIRDAMAEGL